MATTTQITPDYDALHAALTRGTGWGSTAGGTLNQASAASALLDWGEDNDAAGQNRTELAAQVQDWLDANDRATGDNFRENWPGISRFGDSMVRSVPQNRGQLHDAGSPNRRENYGSADWGAVQSAIETTLNGTRPTAVTQTASAG